VAKFKKALKKVAKKAVQQASKTAVKNIKATVKAYTPLAKQLASTALTAYTGGLVSLPQVTPKTIRGGGEEQDYDREISKIQIPDVANNTGQTEIIRVNDVPQFSNYVPSTNYKSNTVSRLFNILGW